MSEVGPKCKYGYLAGTQPWLGEDAPHRPHELHVDADNLLKPTMFEQGIPMAFRSCRAEATSVGKHMRHEAAMALQSDSHRENRT